MAANTLLYLIPSLVASLVPTLLYVWLVWRLDRYEKEPAHLLVAAFVWGAVPAVILSVILELAFETPLAALGSAYTQLISSSVITPPIEEAFKALALLGLARWARREFDGLLDGIIYGSIVGLGFAFTENIFYFVGTWHEGDLHSWGLVVLTRTLAFGLNHAMYTSFTGAALGLARHQATRSRRTALLLAGLALAIAAHAVHNGLLATNTLCWFSLAADWGGVLVILALTIVAWGRERAIMRTHLTPEVTNGLLSQQQFDMVVSRRRRWRQSFRLLGLEGVEQTRDWRRLVATATELAFVQHHATTDADPKLAERGAQLREIVATLRDRIAAFPAAAVSKEAPPKEPPAAV